VASLAVSRLCTGLAFQSGLLKPSAVCVDLSVTGQGPAVLPDPRYQAHKL
jgi:hypothetical protein